MGQYLLFFLLIFAATMLAIFLAPPTGKLALSDA